MDFLFKKSTVTGFFLVLTIIISNLSQLPFFTDNGISSNICMISWSIVFVVSFLCNPRLRLNYTFKVLMSFFFLFSALILINTVIAGKNYFSSSMYYSFAVSIFVFLIGNQIKDFSGNLKKWIFFSYVISALVVAVIVFFRFFYKNSTLGSRIYAYDSKNSLSQILLTAVIFTILCIPTSYLNKLVKLIISTFLLFLIMLMRSRATIFGIVFVLYLALTSKFINRRYKILLVILSSLIVFSVLFNENLYNIVVNNVILAGRNVNDLNDVSSGRVYLIKNGFERFSNNFAFGIGPAYLDCFPVAALLQFGFVPGVVICLYALYPVVFSIQKYKYGIGEIEDKRLYLALLMLSLIYCFDGLFECLTPLGPGVKCYVIWFFIGLYSNDNREELRVERNEQARH